MKKAFLISLMAAFCVTLSAQEAQAWLTAPNSNKLMEAQPAQSLATGAAATQCLIVNADTEYQTVDGFGWMINEGGCMLLKTRLHTTRRQEILREMYDVNEGLGAQIVRVAIGASDVSEYDYTYCDTPDETLASFSLEGPDLTYVIPVLQEIKAINPDVKIMAVPWTAPVWMKENTAGKSGYMGGTLRTQYYGLYAQYFVRYLQAMEEAGLPVWAISPQNEPLHGGNNPSMTFSAQTEYDFINQYLGPALHEAGFGHVRILCYDHNCDNKAFPVYVAQSPYVSGSAFHLYGGDISAMQFVYDRTGKDVYFTEQYTGQNGNFAGDYEWHMTNVMLGSMQNMSRCAIEWNFAADSQADPHTDGGCSDCKGALTIGTNAVSSRNVSYYIVGTMSRVVRTGAKRIATTGAADFRSAAFHNPDGSLGVVAFNTTGSSRQLSVRIGDQLVTYAVPGKGAISIRIPDLYTPFETALEQVLLPALDDNEMMYNIMGQRVDDGYQGIIIQNGNKYLRP
ncbi:MAG: hypothetical protein MJZ89_00660 [Paludibacteraceae bacterium]|nr:hypothetical protein [Paludibacteraceae bacterium]